MGNLFNRGYYHEVAHVQALPLVEDEPNNGQERAIVKSVMSRDPITVQEKTNTGAAFVQVSQGERVRHFRT